MAVVFTHRLAHADSAAFTTTTTASITVATDGSPFAMFYVSTRATGSIPASLSGIVGLGLTWTSIAGGTTMDAGGTAIKVGLWQGLGTAATGTVVVTAASNNHTGMICQFVQMGGADPLTPFGTGNLIQSSGNPTGTSLSLTLPSTPSTGNAILGAVAHLANEDITAGTNYTKGTGLAMGSPTTDLNWQGKTILDTTFDASWVTSSGNSARAHEVTVASSGSPVGFIPI